MGPRCYNGISGGSIWSLCPRGASLGSCYLIHTQGSPRLPDKQGIDESPTPGGAATEELRRRLTGVGLANGQTAEGAEMFKTGPGARSSVHQTLQVTERLRKQDGPTPDPSPSDWGLVLPWPDLRQLSLSELCRPIQELLATDSWLHLREH